MTIQSTTTGSRGDGLLYPLDLVYERAGIEIPRVEVVSPGDIPLPYRSLLVHDIDMTLTLERHFGGRVMLRPLSTFTVGDSYFRRVLLVQEYSGQPVEMGAIRMRLDAFSEVIRGQILKNEIPLGRILREGRFEYASHVKAFLRVTPNPEMMGVFWMREPRPLYGRRTEVLRAGAPDRRHRRGAPARDAIIERMGAEQGYDCVVVGGGPAGATAGTVLAQHGRRVAILERELFPRYHIGESLMPYTWFTFERLGVLDWFAEAACPKKYSVQFVSPTGKVSQPFYFFETIKHPCSTTWQVRRGDFDRMLLDNARSKGADVRQGTAVRELLTDGGRAVGVRAETKDGGTDTIRADAVIDASGRDTFLASKLGWKRRDPDLTKISIFTYYRGAKRDPGLDEGATTVAYIPEKGWFWYIPLPDGIVSVGVVAEANYLYRDTRDPEAIFAREAAECIWDRRPPAQRHAGGAGPRDRRVQLPRRGDRRRRLLPGRRRILVPRPGLLHRRLHGRSRAARWRRTRSTAASTPVESPRRASPTTSATCGGRSTSSGSSCCRSTTRPSASGTSSGPTPTSTRSS